jgi:agmatine deiminase
MTLRTRRTFLKTGYAAVLPSTLPAMAAPTMLWHMPDEGDPHRRTWMAFGASREIWGDKLLPHVRQDLARVANAIARFEPVTMLVRPEDRATAQNLVNAAVTLVDCEIDDLWMRDTGPVFVHNAAGEKAAIGFNFNGWGDKQEYARDALVAEFTAAQSHARFISTHLVLEGGGIEVDGAGMAIMTESCVLNANRNPSLSKLDCEAALKPLLGVDKIIWLPGVAGKDITDGHTDFYARFVRPGVVVAALDTDTYSFDHAVTKKHLEILRDSTDAQGRALEVIVLQAPTQPRNPHRSKDLAAGYINFYVCNGAVIAPEFGDDKADLAAKTALARLFPGREIVQIAIDAIAAGGGGIHCSTQQEPR